MQKFDCVFVNGDSYSATGKTELVYGDFLARKFSVPNLNFSATGSSNQRIIRSSIEYLQKVKTEFQNPLVIIGWSFIRRLEVWYYGSDQTILSRVPDIDSMPDSRLITLNLLLNSGAATVEQKCLVNEDLFVHKQLTDFYTNLYMFANFLQSQNLSYLFFSAARNTDCPVHCFPYVNSLEQVKWVVSNKNIYRLHDFCVMDWAKENDPNADPVTGHLSQSGHEKFSNFILDNMLG